MRTALGSAAHRHRGMAVLVAVVVVLPIAASPALAAAVPGGSWREVLERVVEANRTTPYNGETLLVEMDDSPNMVKVRVRNTLEGGLEVGGGLRVPHDGPSTDGSLTSAGGTGALDLLERLGDKYEVSVVGADDLMDRPCTVLEVRRRHDRSLRERLWVDDASGLLVRRETFAGGEEPVRFATYLSLDLQPGPNAGAVEILAEASEDGLPLESSGELVGGHEMASVDQRGLAALREAGWEVPPSLPGGYAPLGAYTVDAGASQPLQLVYGDGLYVVSIFQQPGTPDWSSLPPGAQLVEDFEHAVYEWPGAVPHRLLWEVDGRTYSLVGDAPPTDLLELASALPQPEAPGFFERLGRGLGRLWSGLTAFAR